MVLQQQFRHQLLELLILLAQLIDLAASGLSLGVTGQVCFAFLEEYFAPLVMHIGINVFAPTQLCDARFATQTFQQYLLSLRRFVSHRF